ncbi:hypothetical protein [Candidatus Mycobacterium methanotrophicum]|uniref:MaoC family dehydratase n=1 Tax=Candidatus Mycobacterium methanotrophicum TaxID=2943498 RepID=A0ABY4QMG3_9MYCO|nr:hypothetical protein [Candidatus Mycobacterium methanotrophicum]UQX11145.1 hypothetical protein M5I08_00745 [Candidatus Mycobacterium methanotrophicum]
MADPLTDEQQHMHRQAVRELMPTTPFLAGLGIVFERYEPDAAKQSDLLCHGRTVRRRKELTFTEITATDIDGNVVAHAVQTYRIV